MSELVKKSQIRTCVFAFSVKLEEWSFHLADLPRTAKKCAEVKKAREGSAKLLFLFIKYAKFVALSLLSRFRSLSGELTQRRRQRQRKRHLKINIWEMVTIFRLLLPPRIPYC